MAEQQSDLIPTITVLKKAERPKRLWRVMRLGGDPSEDTFYDTKEAADAALKAMGGKGAVAGIRFPAKSREEESALKEQYMQQAAIGGNVAMAPITGESEEERITRKISEVNSNATPEQKARFLETLSKSRAKTAEREETARDRFAAFKADVSTRDIATRQLNEYSKNLSLLKRAYRDAVKSRDYLAAQSINENIQEYSRGVPRELGARQEYARRGLLENKKREMEENLRIKREQQERNARLSMTNPDFGDFAQNVSFNRL